MAVQNKQTAKHRQAMIVVLFACNLLASLMQSLMNVALDYVSAEYHVSLSEANPAGARLFHRGGYCHCARSPLAPPLRFEEGHALRADRVVRRLAARRSGLGFSLFGGGATHSGRCHPAFISPW